MNAFARAGRFLALVLVAGLAASWTGPGSSGAAFGAAPAGARAGAASGPARVPVDYVIVILLENRSFDNLFGQFPGAGGIADAGAAAVQRDRDGNVYPVLPQPDARFPADLPNQPFLLDRFLTPDDKHDDLTHRYYQAQFQVDGGRMDRFVAWDEIGHGLAMGYWDGARLPMWRWAQEYTLADRFFSAAFGGSMLNHMLLFCACAPRWPDAPPWLRAELGPDGSLVRDGATTPDGYLVNTAYTVNTPHWPGDNPAELVPNLAEPTIGDRLDAAGVSWAWYMGNWNEALAGHSDLVNFKTHQMAPLYFASYADGTAAKAAHLKDEVEFLDAVRSGTLPAVSFVIPSDGDSQHPGSANISQGEKHTVELLDLIRTSPIWPRSAVIVTWDENGGLWDHVAPPAGDRWGPGPRVPALIVSPYAKKGYVDHTVYDGTSILKFIEWRWGLAPLGDRDAKANNLTAAFTFDTGTPAGGSVGASLQRESAVVAVAALATAASLMALRAGKRRRAQVLKP